MITLQIHSCGDAFLKSASFTSSSSTWSDRAASAEITFVFCCFYESTLVKGFASLAGENAVVHSCDSRWEINQSIDRPLQRPRHVDKIVNNQSIDRPTALHNE